MCARAHSAHTRKVLTIFAKSFGYKGGALLSIFSPASFARSKQMRQRRSLRPLYQKNESVVELVSRHVKKTLVSAVPVAWNSAFAIFRRHPK